MSTAERWFAGLDAGEPASAGVAVAGWLVALLAASLAIWQAARADAAGLRAAEAAHELRGPLCAARLALNSLQRGFPDAPRIARGVAAIELELGRAELALEQLAGGNGRREARRRSRSHAPREVVDLCTLAETAEPAWHALGAAQNTTVELRTAGRPVLVLGDPRRLLQGMENLIANACEHGHGPVRLSIVEGEEGARIDVSDGGRGPSRKVIERARRRASGRIPSRASATSRGHGMAIVARLARDSRGRLRARTVAGGTVVSLELPAAGWRRSRAAAAIDRLRRSRSPIQSLADRGRIEPGRSEPLAGTR